MSMHVGVEWGSQKGLEYRNPTTSRAAVSSLVVQHKGLLNLRGQIKINMHSTSYAM